MDRTANWCSHGGWFTLAWKLCILCLLSFLNKSTQSLKILPDVYIGWVSQTGWFWEFRSHTQLLPCTRPSFPEQHLSWSLPYTKMNLAMRSKMDRNGEPTWEVPTILLFVIFFLWWLPCMCVCVIPSSLLSLFSFWGWVGGLCVCHFPSSLLSKGMALKVKIETTKQ